MLQLACLQQGIQNSRQKQTHLSIRSNRKFLSNCPCTDSDKLIPYLTQRSASTGVTVTYTRDRLAAHQKVCCEGEQRFIGSPKQQDALSRITCTTRKRFPKGNLKVTYHWAADVVMCVSFYLWSSHSNHPASFAQPWIQWCYFNSVSSAEFEEPQEDCLPAALLNMRIGLKRVRFPNPPFPSDCPPLLTVAKLY